MNKQVSLLVIALSAITISSASFAAGEKSHPEAVKPVSVPTVQKLQANGFTVHIRADGTAGNLELCNGNVVPANGRAGEVRYGSDRWALTEPVSISRCGNMVAVAYELPGKEQIQLEVKYQLQIEGKTVVLVRETAVSAHGPLAKDLTVSLSTWPGSLPKDTWLPLVNGTVGKLGDKPAGYDFQGPLDPNHTKISIPMVTFQDENVGRVTYGSDPYFTTLFCSDYLEWTYPKKVGLEDAVEMRRLVTVLHEGTPEKALDAYYQYVLGEVPAGPQWIHDIAMVDYDYMSDGGKGWFNDIDALARALSPEERGKVILAMHGWYDWIGRYSFDATTGQFDKQWTAFGNAYRYKNKPVLIDFEGDKVSGGFEKCEQVLMSPQLVRERLAYAKSKGFRVGLYFADGMTSGTGLPDFNTKRVLRMGGWVGPDTKGKSYCMNPLTPEVHDFFLAYTDALLKEFGDTVDAFVWDETFIVPKQSYGSKEVTGYSTRAMMRLVREVAKKVETYNPQMALLASDCLGLVGSCNYAMVAHGTYQDSWCRPGSWAFCIFPNWRNTAWSCCWWPLHKKKWIEFGVKNYQAPVAISNGWGDNTGFAEMPPDNQKEVLELFRWRAQFQTKMKLIEPLPIYQ